MTRHEFTDKAFATIPELQAIRYHHFSYGIDNEATSYMVSLQFGVFPLSSICRIANAIESIYPYGWVIAPGHDERDGSDCVELCSSAFDAEFFEGIEKIPQLIITRAWYNNHINNNNIAE